VALLRMMVELPDGHRVMLRPSDSE
jgi:hypothetical protein